MYNIYIVERWYPCKWVFHLFFISKYKEDNMSESYNKYVIPENYTNSGNFLGKIPLRNFIDLAVLCGTLTFVELKFISATWIIKFAVVAATVLPIAIVCIIGIDGGSISEYLVRMLSFFIDRKNLRDDEGVDNYLDGKVEETEEDTEDGTKKKRKEHKISTNETTADRIPIEKIENGVVKTVDGNYVKILEILPVNFDLLSATDQNGIIEGFAQFLKVAPISIQFKCFSQQANSEKMVKRMKFFEEKENSDKCKKFINQYISMIQNIGEAQGVSRRFFIIFKFEGFSAEYSRKYAEQEIYNELNTVAQTCESLLKNCGNSVVHHKDENLALETLFYELLNRNTSTIANYEFKKMYTYNYYLKQLEKEREERIANGQDPEADSEFIEPGIRDNIAPFLMDFTGTRTCVCDGLYYKFLFIDANRYKTEVFSAWLNSIVNAGNGIDLDIFARKEDSEKIRDKVKHKAILNKSKFKFSRESASDREEIENAIYSSQYILDAMSGGSEEFYWMTAMITITGVSEDDVEYKARQIKTFFRSKDYGLRECKFCEEQAFLSVLPLCSIDKDIFKRSKRNVLTHGLASTYIFTSLELSDEKGVLFGINQYNNSLCFVDNFDLTKYTTPNMFIIGTSGAGKTYSMQQIAMRYRYQNIQTFILAPLKGREYRRPALALGGSFISISTASNNCINIMEIRDYDKNSTDKKLEDEFGELSSSKLALKAQQLGAFFSLVVADIKSEERQAVDEEIMNTYADFGITTDNSTLYDEYGNMKKMPVLADLQKRLKKNPYTKRVAVIMSRFVTGSAQVFNQQTNVDLSNKYIVFDISDLSKELLPIGMFVVLDFVWDTIKADRTKKKILFLDELWTLIGANSSEFAAEFVLEIFKIIRGYGGVAVAATQDLNDFFALKDGAYGKGIVNQCNNKIILKLKEEEAKRVQNILSLNDSEMKEIVNFDRGQAFFMADKTHLTIKFKATKLEHEYITTDREELASIARRRFEENTTSLIDEENSSRVFTQEEMIKASTKSYEEDYEANRSLFEVDDEESNAKNKNASEALSEPEIKEINATVDTQPDLKQSLSESAEDIVFEKETVSDSFETKKEETSFEDDFAELFAAFETEEKEKSQPTHASHLNNSDSKHEPSTVASKHNNKNNNSKKSDTDKLKNAFKKL